MTIESVSVDVDLGWDISNETMIRHLESAGYIVQKAQHAEDKEIVMELKRAFENQDRAEFDYLLNKVKDFITD